MDVWGNRISTNVIQSATSINTANFNNGIYFFQLETENRVRTVERVVVNH